MILPKVSVIMAAYNAEKYILESINSILDQDFRDIELIICDDASTDSTWSLICEAKGKDGRIVAMQNESNLKAAASRNKCIKLAKGEYIAIQDADDISMPGRLSKQIKALENNEEYDFISSGMSLFDENGVWKKITPKKYPTKYDFLTSTPFLHGSTMFKKSILKNVNGYRVAKETQRGQDFDLFMRLYSTGYKGMNLQEQLYGYRVDEHTLGRRKLKYRYHGVVNRYKNFKKMGLMPIGYIFMFKPIIGWLIPRKVIYQVKKVMSLKSNT